MTETLEWTPPGPGPWELAADHYPRPVTAAMLPTLDVWSEESTAWMTGLGLPIKSVSMRAVNGLPYVTFDDGSGGRKPPPLWVMRIAMKLMPSIRRAERRLSEVFDERPWVEGVASWHSSGRAEAVSRMVGLTRVDPAGLDDPALADHIRACADEVMTSGRQHLRMHAHDTFPPALFVVTAMDLGLERDEAISLLTGSSPASTGQSAELVELRSAVGGRSATSLDELRALGSEVASALDRFLDHHGKRIVDGYDIDSVTIGELPALVVALATGLAPVAKDTESAVARARSRVPDDQRAIFDQRLADARAAYGLRDDNSGILMAWPVGLLRLAMLEAGRRLVRAGAIQGAELALEATVSELGAALTGGATDEAELKRRFEHRRSVTSADAPRALGPTPPPAPDGLPGALGLTMRMFAAFDMAVSREPGAGLRGLGIGERAYTGRARIVRGDRDALERFEAGDVLVAPMTSPSYNVLLSLAGAVVTEEGDVMGHAAIMARELDLPAVLGVQDATRTIRDGQLIAVNPLTGIVEILEEDPAVEVPA